MASHEDESVILDLYIFVNRRTIINASDICMDVYVCRILSNKIDTNDL